MHTRKSSCEFHFTDGESMAGMQCTIHIWIRHAAKPLGLLCAKLGGRYRMEGYFGGRRRVWLEDTIFLPFCLVLLLDSDELIAFVGLQECQWASPMKTIVRRGTCAFQFLGLGDCCSLQRLRGGIYSCHDCGFFARIGDSRASSLCSVIRMRI